jgi:hypothetical protein
MTAGKFDVDAFAKQMAAVGVQVRRLDPYSLEAAQAAGLDAGTRELADKLYGKPGVKPSGRPARGSQEAKQTMNKLRAMRGKAKQPKETKHDDAQHTDARRRKVRSRPAEAVSKPRRHGRAADRRRAETDAMEP